MSDCYDGCPCGAKPSPRPVSAARRAFRRIWRFIHPPVLARDTFNRQQEYARRRRQIAAGIIQVTE